MRPIFPAILLLAASTASCATPTPGRWEGSGHEPVRSGSVISASELEDANVFSALEAIQRLRPIWLRERGPLGFAGQGSEPLVIIDGVQRGSLGSLRNINVRHLREIRFMSSREATLRYGTGFPAGAIVLVTRNSG